MMTTPPTRALVVGADGVIGSALCEHLSRRGLTVFGTTRRKTEIGSRRLLHLDLAEPQIAIDSLPDVDIAIICAAMARFADCRAQPELARRVNVTTPAELAKGLVARGTFVVRLSSSAVFDCRAPHARADQPTAPRSVYGRLQADAESAILGIGDKTAVLRLTKIMTSDFPLVRNWVSTLARGGNIEAFEDHTLCPLPLAAAVEAAATVLEHKQCGIFQASGASDISYAELARHLVRCLGLAPDRVTSVRAVDRGVLADDVTPYTSMDTTGLTALSGFIPPEPFTVFAEVFGQMPARLYEIEASHT
jgi:dTDP-4-dehydrorhamnose reductase